MTKVNFYDEVQDELLKFAVIIAVFDGKLVFCKHKKRDTWEIPGGHREAGEKVSDTAERELSEEAFAAMIPLTVHRTGNLTTPK